MKLNDMSQTRLERESTIRCGVERSARTTKRPHQMSRQSLHTRPPIHVCVCVSNASRLVSYKPHDVFVVKSSHVIRVDSFPLASCECVWVRSMYSAMQTARAI